MKLSFDKFFFSSIALAALQQGFIAVSTWYIAQAGAAVVRNDYYEARSEILWFLGTALAGYLVSAFSQLASNRSQNNIWHKYVSQVVGGLSERIDLGSRKNREKTIGWLTAEAYSTIQFGVAFYVGGASTVLSVIFTVVVFFVVLGHVVGAAIIITLVASLILVVGMRKKIQQLSNDLQATKVGALTGINMLWSLSVFGNSGLLSKELAGFEGKAKSYFDVTNRYTALEQVIACTPVVISVLLIIVGLTAGEGVAPTTVGVVVAVLPRSLQLFGSIHSLSMYMTQFYMVNQRFKNLENFVGSLESQNLETQVSTDAISIYNLHDKQVISVNDLLASVIAGDLSRGRIFIQGANGVGKSSLLKLIKLNFKSAVLISPESDMYGEDSDVSTGQKHLFVLRKILSSDIDMILLDEWDANLDEVNQQLIGALVDERSKSSLIIEVRHGMKYFDQTPPLPVLVPV